MLRTTSVVHAPRCIRIVLAPVVVFASLLGCGGASQPSPSGLSASTPAPTTSSASSAAVPSASSTAASGAGAKPCDVSTRQGEDPKACNELGVRYLTGEDVKKDDTVARDLFERSCKGGIVDGCANLAFLLEHGRGGPADGPRAVKLNTQACDADNTTACFNLGAANEFGKAGLPVNRARALELYTKACSLKLPPACEDARRLGGR